MSGSDIIELKERVARLETQIDLVLKRLDRIEQKMDKIMVNRYGNSNLYKWVTLWIGMVLSFVATLFGLGWVPP